jgi:hypothetical protein
MTFFFESFLFTKSKTNKLKQSNQCWWKLKWNVLLVLSLMGMKHEQHKN